MKHFIYTYNTNPEKVSSCFRFRAALEKRLESKVPIISSESDKVPTTEKVKIINWGYSKMPTWYDDKTQSWVNHFMKIRRTVNKLDAFNRLKLTGVSIPRITANLVEAMKWQEKGTIILARTTATGYDGEGIKVVRPGETLPSSPSMWYSAYVPKILEYRISVVNGGVVDVQQKKVKDGFTQDKDQKLIRTSSGGWVLCRENIMSPSSHTKLNCTAALNSLGLHFGGVDVVVDKETGMPMVLEVNTAPEIFEMGAKRYASALV